ncbi:MAG TPA: hypothetical protein VKA84_25815 [Gemmatimonadaceae bacterium]|nr:hypothetical protein [Gemmatimonadaceae bacterium]
MHSNASTASDLEATLASDPYVASPAERHAYERETFLSSAKSQLVLPRELERLSTAITRRVASAEAELGGVKAEIRRSPGRCIVQLGPVALTISWVRSGAGSVAEGRLMAVEWRGTVARSPERIPERAAPTGTPATLVREDVLMAVATGEPDWRWRRESTPEEAGHTSAEVAERCVDALLKSLAMQRQQ